MDEARAVMHRLERIDALQREGAHPQAVLAELRDRVRVDAGRLSTPPHSHGAAEELVYVLGGSGFVWQDEAVFEIGPGDCVVFPANELGHTPRGGPGGFDVALYGTPPP